MNLNFVSPHLAPALVNTPYVAFEKTGSQLYVNRGIGTIGVTMRAGASPNWQGHERRIRPTSR